MLERFLKQTHFTSEDDYRQHLEFIVPHNFNFAYDVMDVWAQEQPDKLALLWTNDQGLEQRYTFADLRRLTDQAASYFLQIGIGRGDMVMLILKRRVEWWISILALHKIGAVAIPATHMLTKHDIVYRNNAASVKSIICLDDAYVMGEIEKALPESPTLERVIVVSDGEIVLQGKPREIFSQVERMRELHLDVPRMTSLAHELRGDGMPLSEGILTVDEMAEEVSRLLCPSN